MKTHEIIAIFIGLTLALTSGCTEKELDPSNPKASFGYAKEPYDDEHYEIAINKLGEFKSRFPYSQYATEAELLIANAQFELQRYPEAVVSYEQFVKLHPKHPQADFAMFRVGESYWKDAPEEANREQEFTSKAIEEWRKLIDAYTKGEHSDKARKLIMDGRKRLADHAFVISEFYCRKEIFHACAFRSAQIEKDFPEFPDLRRKALRMAAKALDEVAKQKEADPESDKNLYVKSMTAAQIREEAAKLRAAIDNIK